VKFVDLVTIKVRAGDGGSGIISFRREKFIPKGGPDGGNGGRGASVILRANRHMTTLLDFQYRHNYTAPEGAHGEGAKRTGRSGEDIVIEVPEGTIARDTTTQEIIADMLKHGDEVVVVRGGRGGRGNSEFATSVDQAPRRYEQGQPGEERELELELKLLADVGLVGLPNAGKSTLISVISAARPKIADYPFTTLVPNLGIVRVDEGKSFVVADIPGLIAGAHQGKGLGLQFLRHIERTRVLVFLLDATRGTLKDDLDVLMNELRQYDASLVKRKTIVVITKTDALDDETLQFLKKDAFGRKPVAAISAVAGTNVRALVEEMWQALHPREQSAPRAPRTAVERPAVKRPVAKRPAAKRPAAKRTGAKPPAPKRTTTKGAAAKRTTAKRTPAKRPAAKRPTVKRNKGK
jgi:GTPase